MKNLFISLMLLLLTTIVMAQDVIITQKDEMIKAYNVEVGKTIVFYQLTSDPDAPIQKLAKSDIFIIKMADGTKIDPNKEADTAIAESAPSQTESVFVARPVDEKRRKEIIESYMPKIRKATMEEMKAKLTGWGKVNQYDLYMEDFKELKKLSSSKKPKALVINPYALWVPSEQSEVCNEDLEIRIIRREFYLYNRSQQTIFVDLANTFIVNAQGKSDSFFHGTSSSTTTGQGVGSGFNLGGITNALGIGGLVGSLANATTIGNSSSSSTTTTTTEQRILSIPPMSERLVPGNEITFPDHLSESTIELCKQNFHWPGDTVVIPKGMEAPITLFTTYSKDMNFSRYSTLNIQLELYSIWMYDSYHISGYKNESPNKIFVYCEDFSTSSSNLIVPE